MSQELILNGFYEDEAPRNSVREAINWFPVKLPQGSFSQYSLYPTSGIEGPVTVTNVSGLNAGLITSQVTTFNSTNFREIAFAKDSYFLLTDGSSVNFFQLPSIGGFQASTNQARFAKTDDDLVMVCPSSFNAGRSFAYAIDRDLIRTPIDLDSIIGGVPALVEDVAFAGGRVVYMSSKDFGPTAFRCYYSNIGATAPLSTNFFQPDSPSSAFRGLANINGSLYLFTEDRTYLFTVSGSTTTPFQWQRGATAEVGLLGPQAKDTYQNSLIFVGRRQNEGYKVFLFTGSDATPLSTKAIDYQLSEELKQSLECRVFTFSEKGYDFTAIRTINRCFVYSHSFKNWHERSTNGVNWEVTGSGLQGSNTVAIGQTVLNVNLGTNLQFNIGRMNRQLATEYLQQTTRTCTTAHFNDSGKQIRISELEPVCDVDLENSVGSPENDIRLEVSTDFGATFEDYGAKGVGPRVERGDTRFMQLGSADEAFTVRLSTAGYNPISVLKIYARLKSGVRQR